MQLPIKVPSSNSCNEPFKTRLYQEINVNKYTWLHRNPTDVSSTSHQRDAGIQTQRELCRPVTSVSDYLVGQIRRNTVQKYELLFPN